MKILNAQIYQEDGSFWEGTVCTDGGLISEQSGDTIELDASGCYLIPGLIDIHLHGCAGYDYCSCGAKPSAARFTSAKPSAAQSAAARPTTAEEPSATGQAGQQDTLSAIARYEAACGVTTICPATMTLPQEQLLQICRHTAAYDSLADPRGAEIAGIYMEGPFLAPEKSGAQDRDNLYLPDIQYFHAANVAAAGRIRFLAVAPELEGAETLIRSLTAASVQNGVEAVTQGKIDENSGRTREIVSGNASLTRQAALRITLAHTAADYDTACRAFAAGASQVTHLYNAMNGMHHRKPGLVGAAADTPGVFAELICDGIHVHPAVVRQTFKMFGTDRIVLISDSMEATGMPDGHYELGGQSVIKEGRKAVLAPAPGEEAAFGEKPAPGETAALADSSAAEPVLAGSVSTLADCLRTAVLEMRIPLEDAIRCAAVNPAKAAGIYDRCGSISIGKKADLVLLEKESLRVRKVILRGHALA